MKGLVQWASVAVVAELLGPAGIPPGCGDAGAGLGAADEVFPVRPGTPREVANQRRGGLPLFGLAATGRRRQARQALRPGHRGDLEDAHGGPDALAPPRRTAPAPQGPGRRRLSGRHRPNSGGRGLTPIPALLTGPPAAARIVPTRTRSRSRCMCLLSPFECG